MPFAGDRPQGACGIALGQQSQVTCTDPCREDSMHRRNLFRTALASVGAALASSAVTEAQAATPDKTKVVYHLNETDKVAFVIGNIENHIEGVGGPDKVTIALVVHGPA